MPTKSATCSKVREVFSISHTAVAFGISGWVMEVEPSERCHWGGTGTAGTPAAAWLAYRGAPGQGQSPKAKEKCRMIEEETAAGNAGAGQIDLRRPCWSQLGRRQADIAGRG